MSTIDPAAALDELLDPERVWAMRSSDVLALIASARRAAAGEVDAFSLADAPRPRAGSRVGDTATIPVVGPITRRPSFLSWLFGGTSTEEISQALRAALDDGRVHRIVLHVDSGGGEVDGITELADEIFQARSKKPITAMVDTMAASAAYWLASQASEVVVTPSGQVGSIGVFTLHFDRSRALDAAGITPTFIQAGTYKTEGNPLQPLTDAAKAEIQRRIDAFQGMFVRDVARGRGTSTATVASSYGQGRMVLAPDAVRVGMADRVGTRDSLASGAGHLAIAAAAAVAALAALKDVDDEAFRSPALLEQLTAPSDLNLTIAKASALAACALAETAALAHPYVVVPWSRVPRAKLVIAAAAVQVATRDLRLSTAPEVEFFLPDDGTESGERFTRSRDTGGIMLDDGRLIRVRADADARRLVEIIGHEVAHCAQSPAADPSERERSAREYEDRFAAIFWRSSEATLADRALLGAHAA